MHEVLKEVDWHAVGLNHKFKVIHHLKINNLNAGNSAAAHNRRIVSEKCKT